MRLPRVVRFVAKLAFKIEAKTEAPIERLAHLLATVPLTRMFEEVLLLFHWRLTRSKPSSCCIVTTCFSTCFR